MEIFKVQWKLGLVVTAAFLGILLLAYFRSTAVAEEEQESSFSLNSVKFTFYPPIKQPLPIIENGVALDECLPTHVDGFFLSDTSIKRSDFPEFFEMLGGAQPTNDFPHQFTSFQLALFFRYLNEAYAPELARKGKSGYFVLPSSKDIIRVLNNGAVPADGVKYAGEWMGILLADRYSDNASWAGVNNGMLAVGGISIRRERLQCNCKRHYCSWPISIELPDFFTSRRISSDSYMGYYKGPADVERRAASFRIKYRITEE